jgi:hypothetical protein
MTEKLKPSKEDIDVSNNGKMVNFPLVVLDDFYEDIEAIRKLALKLQYFPDLHGNFPGKRTKNLLEINSDLYQYCCTRFLSLFFDFAVCQNLEWAIDTRFQLVDPINNLDDPLNIGWTHVDNRVLAAAVVYLTPDPEPNSGTTIYKAKPGIDLAELDIGTLSRNEFYKTGNISPDYLENLNKHNSHFDESIVVKNQYNRIIAYDSNMYHRASSHHAGTNTRLTQVFFLYDMANCTRTTTDKLKYLRPLSDFKIKIKK